MILKESQSTYGKMKSPSVTKIRKPLFPGGSSILLLEPSGKSLVELGSAYAPAFIHAHTHSWLPNIPFVNYCHWTNLCRWSFCYFCPISCVIIKEFCNVHTPKHKSLCLRGVCTSMCTPRSESKCWVKGHMHLKCGSAWSNLPFKGLPDS